MESAGLAASSAGDEVRSNHSASSLGALGAALNAEQDAGAPASALTGAAALRRLSGGSDRRQSQDAQARAFEQNRNEAVQGALLEVRSVYFLTMAIGFLIVAIATYFEVRSVYVLVVSYGIRCDKPLWNWLLGHLLFNLTRELCVQRLKVVFLFFHILWTFYGFSLLHVSRTCKDTNPELFTWVEIVLVVSAVFLTACTVLPLLMYMIIMMLVALVNNGVITNRKAARAGTLEQLESVDFDPELFAKVDDPNDDRPTGECCCCTEEFDHFAPIVRTPCGHYYHKHCLGDWLKLARTCPLCRCDLEEAVWSRVGLA